MTSPLVNMICHPIKFFTKSQVYYPTLFALARVNCLRYFCISHRRSKFFKIFIKHYTQNTDDFTYKSKNNIWYTTATNLSMLPEALLLSVIKKAKLLSAAQISAHKKAAKKAKLSLAEYFSNEGIFEEADMYKMVGKAMKIPFVDLRAKTINKDVLNIIPATLAQTHQVIAFEQTTSHLSLAMLDPQDLQTIEFIQRKTGLIPQIFITTPTDIKNTLRRYHADINQEFNITEVSADTDDPSGDLKKAAEELPVINIVNSILEHAIGEGASDIHIEPVEHEVHVRYRIDGILRQVMSLPKKVQNGLIARIKILSNVKIDEHMVPQDGRFKMKMQDDAYSFRVSFIPVYDGEKIVMRLLHEGQKPLDLDQLGFLPGPKELVQNAISRPHGMVLVTGPTGSGKTTTLYSVLGMLHRPDVNISTIEDPVEYHIEGINQSQVNTRVGFTFASGLRAFLRQDPDIIMVGEIRDEETAEIAVHAAMTGHLVLSTLHTNDAPTTLPRLIDMDIPAFLVGFTANVIIAQRLVRKICTHCREEFSLEADSIKQLDKFINFEEVIPLFKKQGIRLKKSESSFKKMTFFRGKGCARCGNSGYKGRVGIYEVMDIDKSMAKLISDGGSVDDIKQAALDQGMITIMQDGIIKAKQGMTTIEEVLRVTKE